MKTPARFCQRGHDKDISGRYSDGRCGECHRMLDKWRPKRSREKEKRLWYLRVNYGLTESQYNALLEKQKGVCAVCGEPPTAQRLAVDHDHARKVIRGLLCGLCNLNRVGANTSETARKVMEYLREYET